jgi:HAD superfamily hydrolase (TIGR01509 family)
MRMKQPDLWIVFDLGGVLFDFHGIHGLAEITGRTYDTVHASLKHSPACRLYETGKIDGDEFAALLRDELALDMPAAELLERWAGWLGGSKPGVTEMLGEVRMRHNTACLTNTSPLHWDGLTGIHGVDGLFDRTFASHQIGHWKPDPEIFAHVAGALGPQVRRIVYFDDNQHIVDGARAFGWDAHQALGPDDIRSVLGRLGLL